MNKNKLIVLSYLRQNARESLTGLSKKTSIPVSTLSNKIKNNDFVDKYTCLLNYDNLGLSNRAIILFRVERELRDDLQEYLINSENTNNVSKINDGYDIFVDTVFKDLKEMKLFLEGVEEKFPILEKQIHPIIEDVKREGFMANPNNILEKERKNK